MGTTSVCPADRTVCQTLFLDRPVVRATGKPHPVDDFYDQASSPSSRSIRLTSSPRRRLAVFDVDGTLVDSQNGIVEAQRMAFAANGLEPPSREKSLSIVGLSLTEAFTVLVGAAGPVAALSQAYRDAWQHLRSTGTHDDPLFPGAGEALTTLKARGIVLGVATGKSRRGVAHLVGKYDWQDLFETIQTADHWPSKPAPDMLRAALAETGIDAADAVMIGDTAFDMAMARTAGVRPIGVGWGYHSLAALEAAGAQATVADFPALLALAELS